MSRRGSCCLIRRDICIAAEIIDKRMKCRIDCDVGDCARYKRQIAVGQSAGTLCQRSEGIEGAGGPVTVQPLHRRGKIGAVLPDQGIIRRIEDNRSQVVKGLVFTDFSFNKTIRHCLGDVFRQNPVCSFLGHLYLSSISPRYHLSSEIGIRDRRYPPTRKRTMRLSIPYRDWPVIRLASAISRGPSIVANFPKML
ncbi:MAG: hypothetical protein A4E66_02279 [Syntrophus sp. PtaB.Bin001]|nr:MAG: hypothetical protein A4E66_02279 [Syntrophus sp. PtaB.Bin001]